jgi:hypothetical protein
MEETSADGETAALWRRDARRIQDGMLRHFVDEEGCWLWCLDPTRLTPVLAETPENKGFGAINGVACMYADVLDLEPLQSGWEGITYCRRTFDRLLSYPPRKEQFEKHGLWMQQDHPQMGLYCTPSYSGGYALQTMLLYEKLDLADRLITWLAQTTFHAEERGILFTNFRTGRISPYYFFECYCSPDAVGIKDMLAGCGPLNLLNVAEPLKVARLILGIDDSSSDTVKILPRLPSSWSGVEAVRWPVRTNGGMVRADIRFECIGGGASFRLQVAGGGVIPRLAIRLPSPKGWRWHQATEVRELAL